MFQERARTLQGVSATLDVLCLTAAFALAFSLRIYHDVLPILSAIPSVPWRAEKVVRTDYAMLLLVSIFAWVISMRRSGLYRFGRMRGRSGAAFALFRALCLAVFATSTAVYILKIGSVSRIFFAYYFTLGFLLLTMKQLSFLWILNRLRSSEVGRRHALVIGAGHAGSWFANILQDAAEHGYQLVGLLMTRKFVTPQTFSVPMLGTIDDLDRVLLEHAVDEVFIVGGAAELLGVAGIAEELIKRGRVVSLVSIPATTAHDVRGRVTEFSGIPMISFGPMPRDEVALGVKRVIDVAVSAAALVLLSPIMLVVATAIKVFDPGPVFFAQERLGGGGARFRLYKFRSMRTDAEAVLAKNPDLQRRYVASNYKLPQNIDPRVSRLGRFLRTTSLDELPQLWNVLKGEMSLVGPRPIVPDEIEEYGPYGDLFLSVRPGLTGHWQVRGRSTVQYPERAFMDLDYIASNSLLNDVAIMAQTVPAVIKRRGAH